MSVDSVIAKAVGMMLQRGVSSADAIEAAAKLQRIAKIGAPVVVEMFGLQVTLNGGGARRRHMHRPGGRIG